MYDVKSFSEEKKMKLKYIYLHNISYNVSYNMCMYVLSQCWDLPATTATYLKRNPCRAEKFVPQFFHPVENNWR